MTTKPNVYRFPPNELDLSNFELRRAGKKIPLSRIPMNLLVLLMEQHGRLVTRDQIAAHLWTQPELIDVEAGINAAIKRIRAVLNDDPVKPRFIETVIGRGYRFIGEVETEKAPEDFTEAPPSAPRPSLVSVPAFEFDAASGAKALSAPKEPPHTPAKRGGVGWALKLSVVAALILAGGVLYKWTQSRAAKPATWTRTQFTTNDNELRVTASAISPDGTSLAYADAEGIFLCSLPNGRTYALKAPSDFRVSRMAWFPDHLRILVTGLDEKQLRPALWMVSVAGAGPFLVRDNARNGAPSPDGTQIAFTNVDDSEIWLAGSDGQSPRRLIGPHNTLRYPYVFWTRDANTLAFQCRSDRTRGIGNGAGEIEADYNWEFQTLDVRSGKGVFSAPHIYFESAEISSSGEMFFLRTQPYSDGDLLGLWKVRVDAQTGKFLAAPRQLEPLHGALAFGITVSSDGKKASAVIETGQPDVYVANVRLPGPTLEDVRRLTFDTKSDYPHAWTSDSRTIIFESNRDGKFRLYQQRVNQRTAEALFARDDHEQIMPQITPDGAWLLYAQLDRVYASLPQTLYRARLDGTEQSPVPLPHPLDEFRCPVPGGHSCVLRETVEQEQYVFYELDPLRGRGAELARTAWLPSTLGDWAVSPDGTTAAIPGHESGRPEIRLVPLDGVGSKRHEQVIRVQGINRLWGLHWAVDGKGWYAEDKAADGSSLLYISADGTSRTTRRTTYNTWAVPSPDGRKLAFVDYTLNRNAWLWQRSEPK